MLRQWIRKNEIDTGKHEGLTTNEREHMKRLDNALTVNINELYKTEVIR